MTEPLTTLATIFLTPMKITTNGWSLLWIIPLVIIIAVVYKATKVYEIKFFSFVKESAALTLTILGFMVMIAVVLHIVVYFIT